MNKNLEFSKGIYKRVIGLVFLKTILIELVLILIIRINDIKSGEINLFPILVVILLFALIVSLMHFAMSSSKKLFIKDDLIEYTWMGTDHHHTATYLYAIRKEDINKYIIKKSKVTIYGDVHKSYDGKISKVDKISIPTYFQEFEEFLSFLKS